MYGDGAGYPRVILVDGREVLGQIVWKTRKFLALSDADFNP
jgi:hypothetical protein